MAAQELSLDNPDVNQEGMKDKLTKWMLDDQSRPGEWLLVTIDGSKRVKDDRVHWIFGPENPGPMGRILKKNELGSVNDDEDAYDAACRKSLEDAVFAMKCLSNGKVWVPGTEPDSSFADLEDYVFPAKKKNGDIEKIGKKGKGLPCMLIASVKCSVAKQLVWVTLMDDNKSTPKIKMVWGRNLVALKNECSFKLDNSIDCHSLQDLSVDTIIAKAEANVVKI